MIQICFKIKHTNHKHTVYFQKQNKKVTYQTIVLFRTCTSACTEQMTTLSWIRSEASTSMTLRWTEDFIEFLTIMLPFAPASFLAWFVAGWTYDRERNWFDGERKMIRWMMCGVCLLLNRKSSIIELLFRTSIIRCSMNCLSLSIQLINRTKFN